MFLGGRERWTFACVGKSGEEYGDEVVLADGAFL